MDYPSDDTAAAHLGLLDRFPNIRNLFDSNPEYVSEFGLPVQLKDYGEFVTIRLQGAFLQVWASDGSADSKEAVVIGNVGDAAKVVGLWPQSALMPGAAPVSQSDP